MKLFAIISVNYTFSSFVWGKTDMLKKLIKGFSPLEFSSYTITASQMVDPMNQWRRASCMSNTENSGGRGLSPMLMNRRWWVRVTHRVHFIQH